MKRTLDVVNNEDACIARSNRVNDIDGYHALRAALGYRPGPQCDSVRGLGAQFLSLRTQMESQTRL